MPRPATRDEVLRRYPRIVSHLIAESLGYFLPEAAAGAVLAVLEKRGCACEWYCHMSGVSGRSLEEIGLDTLRSAIRHRRHHRGFMAEYKQARMLVHRLVTTGRSPLFASWF